MRNTSVALAAMSLLIGASFSFAARPQPSTVSLQAVVKGLNNPTYVADPGDGSSRLFITLQAGRIVVFEGKRVLPTPFLDLTSLVSCCSDGGLFGIAFDPRYASNRYFYVLCSDSPGDLANTHIVIARYQTSATKPNVADPASATIMLKIPHPIHTDHYGGMLQFRPGDRDECKLNGGRCYLYISTGDGGRYPNGAGDPEGNAQDLGSLLGKMLRIDVTNVS